MRCDGDDVPVYCPRGGLELERYYAESSNDDAFESVLNRFPEHDAVVRNEYWGEWVVRYEGDIYWTELDYEGF